MKHRSLVLFIAVLALLTNNVWGQVSVTTPTAILAEGAERFDKLLLVPDDFKPTLQKVAIVKVTTKVAKPTITVTDEQRSSVPYELLAYNETGDNGTTNYYLVTRQGHTWFHVFGVDFENKAYISEQIDFVVGKPVPPIPPPPPPPGPDDLPKDFDGIASKVLEWSKGLPVNTKIGDVYMKYSKLLVSADGAKYTTNDIGDMLVNELKTIPEYANYKAMSDQVQADLVKRWNASFTKGVFSDYLKCVALGLGAK